MPLYIKVWFTFIALMIFLFAVMAFAKNNTVIIPVGDDHYVAASDIVWIQRTLLGIFGGILVWLGKQIISLFFKKQDSTEHKLDEIMRAISRLEGNVTYLERTSVKKEDLVELVRREIKYREE